MGPAYQPARAQNQKRPEKKKQTKENLLDRRWMREGASERERRKDG